MVVLGFFLMLLGLAAFLLGVRLPEPERDDPEQYLRSLESHDEEADEFQQLLAEPFATRILRPIASRLAEGLSITLPSNYRDRIQDRLVYAGLAGAYRAEEVLTAQLLLAAVGLLLAFVAVGFGVVSSNVGIVLLVLLPVIGLQIPRSLIERQVEERQGAIRKDLPDTLDLLAISVEAGVGFEGAMGVVCDNFDSALADEFSRTLREMELGLPRRQALENLKRRTEVPELSNFILTLTQADALGMPIGRVLKTQAAEMRSKRRQWAREKAAKLPVKILLPLMPILLATFIVVLGPAGAKIGGAFN